MFKSKTLHCIQHSNKNVRCKLQ